MKFGYSELNFNTLILIDNRYHFQPSCSTIDKVYFITEISLERIELPV
jgi:hypothetical protein